ncbi:MAG TPA: MG2 domain-containing protein, partial [Lacibacter sp.]|nr:MG2 domain-containing protein [Lacibacter sp.]
MKRVPLLVLLLLLLHQLSAQPTFSYDAAWKKVTELAEEKGLTESALREVQRIYEAARAAGNQPQLIKALVYRIRLQQRREEDADVKAIRELDQEIANSPEPARSLLNSLLAGAYWNYLQQNRYLLHNRTNTTGFEKTDIRTWTSEDLHRKIAALFHASLQERILLQQTNIETFDPVLQQGNMRHLRPTLFDLLAHRALAYYRSDDHSLTRPADAFEISTASAYDPAADFVTRRFPTTDTNSLHHRALLLYQELLQFRLNNSNTPALVDADLDRLVFVNSRSTHPDKRALYRQSLQHLWHQYATQPLVAQAAYLLAQDYADEAATYDYRQHKEGSTTNPRYRYQEAVTICRQVVAQADSSEGKFNCFNLLQQIEQKDLRLRLEKVNLPQQPLRALVTYRNVPQAWFRVVRISAGGRDSLEGRSYDPSYWKRLTALPAVQQFQHALPATGDYQQHHTEIAVNKLPAGTYLLLASTTADFSTSNNLLAAGYFHVSNIAWMEEGHQLFVVHRESGQPLPGARVTVWEQQYDYNSSRYVSVKGKTFTTNVNGFVLLPDNSSYNRYSRTLEVSYEAETLHLDDRANSYVYRPGKPDTDEARNRQTFLFTDRSLYRPGQTVYFKGLVTTRTTANGRYRTVPRFQTMVYLYDVNYQRVDSLQVTSNAFGSYAGTFLLPVNRVNGQYRLVEADKQQAAAFSVEEYKRPKFYVEYKPVEQSYHLNSEVTVTGNALAYAGNAVDGAIVRYRVVRKARLPYPWLCWRWGWPELRSQEISQGETRTRADGSFDVRFTAQPDNQVARELDPVFDFEIAAEVTDLNGETRSGTTRLSAGYKQLDLQLQLPLGESMPADSLTHLLVFTRNQMGVHVPAQVTIVLHRLAAPDRLLRDRYWETPDQFVLSEAAFRKQFPYDPYKDEQEKESWSRTGLFLEQTDSSRSNGRFDLRTTAKKPF